MHETSQATFTLGAKGHQTATTPQSADNSSLLPLEPVFIPRLRLNAERACVIHTVLGNFCIIRFKGLAIIRYPGKTGPMLASNQEIGYCE